MYFLYLDKVTYSPSERCDADKIIALHGEMFPNN